MGDVVTTRRETELRKEPYVDSESLGILPAKSLVTLTGEEKGKFVGVEVELEEGAISGWIDSSVIRKKEVRQEEALSGETEDSETPKIIQTQKGKKRKKKMIPVPSDEGILLRRNPSFSYGAFGGAHYDSMTIQTPPGNTVGSGFTGGATLSFLLDPSFRLRTELGYTSHAGLDANSRLLSFTFLDISAVGEFPLGDSFYIFAGPQYSLGIGMDNAENVVDGTELVQASDVSGIWGQAGIGFRFSAGEMSSLSIRLRYQGALGAAGPVSFHSFGGQLVWEIEG